MIIFNFGLHFTLIFMTIHKEGYIPLAITITVLSLLNLGVSEFLGDIPFVQSAFLGFSAFVFILILQFFRSPKRTTVANPDHIIAPADGKVVVIEEVIEGEYFNEKRIQISIFMSPLNVHVNRSPVGGVVKHFQYNPGKYLVAWHPKSSTENERTTAVVQTEKGIEILFKQIAGAVARRIKWYIKPGDKIGQGEEYGFIKFGSRVDIHVPVGTEINVNMNQVVRGGETVIATLK
ncbi:MAG: phosphatidylserine decarboxylase [Sphingobacteriales bacterium]|jgi:phosphatidylserine decarboxylase